MQKTNWRSPELNEAVQIVAVSNRQLMSIIVSKKWAVEERKYMPKVNKTEKEQ